MTLVGCIVEVYGSGGMRVREEVANRGQDPNCYICVRSWLRKGLWIVAMFHNLINKSTVMVFVGQAHKGDSFLEHGWV